jgi:hypothetical protein
MQTFDRAARSLSRRSGLAATVAMSLVMVPTALSVHAPASAAASDPLQLTASWSASKIVSGNRAKVSGSVRPAASMKRILLQRRMPDGWVTVDSVDPAASTYALRIPTGWYSNLAYRVKAVGVSGTRSVYSPTRNIRVVPSYDPRGAARTYTLADKPVARWNPCEPIGYRVNAKQARAGALKDVKGALRRVSQATGLTFRYRGSTRIIAGPNSRYPENTDLVVAWAKPSQSPVLVAGGGPMGIGGATWGYGFRNADGSPASKIQSGFVVIDANQQRRTPGGFGKGQTRGELLMHELGHAVGLQHVNDRRQLMNPLMQPARARWGAGDLTGLRKLGAGRGCLSKA